LTTALDPYEVAGVVFGVLGVYLTVRENVWCWPVGIANVSLFIVVFYRSRLYADMGLQVGYVVLCAYGWWAWLHGGDRSAALPVARTPRGALRALTLLGALVAFGLGLALKSTTRAALPFLDSGLTSASLVAQYMTTRKWLENWAVWIAADAIYVGMYVYKQLYLTALLYAVFLGLAVLGWRSWKRSLAGSS